ncbi:MAG: hypothetical protein PHY34_04580 [Patescibacteria group bacterium]|nr:hypothetical protein [Patescibacteria group bacterium]
MDQQLSIKNAYQEFLKGEKILTWGSRLIISGFILESVVVSVFLTISTQLTAFIQFIPFFSGVVLIAFGYIQTDKFYKVLKANIVYKLSPFSWFSSLIILFLSVWLTELHYEFPNFPAWLNWLSIVLIMVLSELFIHFRKQAIKNNKINLDI